MIVSCSGGARMMEGTISLMQLAKVSAALARLDEVRLPFISVLTDPTTGGVTASYAMLGDINIAEPGALIGFAGPRVIEQTIRQKLPEGISDLGISAGARFSRRRSAPQRPEDLHLLRARFFPGLARMTYEESVRYLLHSGTGTCLAAAGQRHKIRSGQTSPCCARRSANPNARLNPCTSPAPTERAPRRDARFDPARRGFAHRACTLRRISNASTNAFAWTARKFPTRILPPHSRACAKRSRNCWPPEGSPRIPPFSNA